MNADDYSNTLLFLKCFSEVTSVSLGSLLKIRDQMYFQTSPKQAEGAIFWSVNPLQVSFFFFQGKKIYRFWMSPCHSMFKLQIFTL